MSNEDLKAKMRESLDKKAGATHASAASAGAREKVHGSEVVGGGPKIHRRKSGAS